MATISYQVTHKAWSGDEAGTSETVKCAAVPVEASETYENLDALDRLITAVSGPRFSSDRNYLLLPATAGEDDAADLKSKVDQISPELIGQASRAVKVEGGVLTVVGVRNRDIKEGSTRFETLSNYVDYQLGGRLLRTPWGYSVSSPENGTRTTQKTYQTYIDRRVAAIKGLITPSDAESTSPKAPASQPKAAPSTNTNGDSRSAANALRKRKVVAVSTTAAKGSEAAKNTDIATKPTSDVTGSTSNLKSCINKTAKFVGGVALGSVGFAVTLLGGAFLFEAMRSH